MREWTTTPSAKEAWVRAIASDPAAPSFYATAAFQNSGLPFEDAAETTALYFLVLGAPAFAVHEAAMPARFALLRARFGEVAG